MSLTEVIYLTRHPHRTAGGTDDVAVETFRGPGPGGQKRNKTSSAVRAKHLPTGISAVSDDSRNQHKNREVAIGRLRHELTVLCRQRVFLNRLEPPEGFQPTWLDVSPKSELYLPTLGWTLDVLAATGWVISTAAEHLGTTTGQLSRFLTADDKAMAQVNKMRLSLSLRPLERR